jgi:hypothetical protein
MVSYINDKLLFCWTEKAREKEQYRAAFLPDELSSKSELIVRKSGRDFR